MKKEKIYLAIPYSIWDLEKSFKLANKMAAKLMKEGYIVFSPISHSHPIGKLLTDHQLDHDFWMNQDLPWLECCDRVILAVPNIPNVEKLIANSKGISRELEKASELNIPVSYRYES